MNTRSNCGAAELGSVAQVYTKAFGGDAMREEVQIPSSGDSVVPLEPEPEPLNSLDEGNSLMEYQSEKSEREMDCPKVVIAENEELTDEELMRCIVDGKPMRKTQVTILLRLIFYFYLQIIYSRCNYTIRKF